MYNSLDMETTLDRWMFMDRWMDKTCYTHTQHTHTHTHTHTLECYSSIKSWNLAFCSNTDGLGG